MRAHVLDPGTNAIMPFSPLLFIVTKDRQCYNRKDKIIVMSPELSLLLAVIIIGFAGLFWFVNKKLSALSEKKQDTTLLEWLKSMEAKIESTNKTLHTGLRGSSDSMHRVLQENSKQLNERLDTAAKVIGDLKKNLGEMSEIGKNMQSLQDFLKSPKLRGNIGEQVLTDMIGQVFPKNSFHLQYGFKSGMKADAVLQTDAGLLCIDAKFPMENFTRMVKGETEAERNSAKRAFTSDIKKHVTDISKKYILPEENTLDFALMYIPSEPVYYEIASMPEITDFSRRHRVYPVSPNTLYAHLQVLLLSFQGKQLEKKSYEVFRLLRAIQNDYDKIDGAMGILGKHINNAFNSMNSVTTAFSLLGQKLTNAQGLESMIQSEKKQVSTEEK